MAGQSGEHRRFFSRRGPTLPLCTGAFFRRGGPVIPSIPQGMGNTKVPTEEKSGSSVLYSRLHGNSNPKGFPKLPGAMAGQPGRRGRFFPRRGPTSPLCTGAFLQRGGPVLPRNPAGNGKHKSSHRRKKVGVVFIKAEPTDKAGGRKLKRGWEEHPALCHNRRERES